MAESEVQDGSGTKWPSNTDLVFSDRSSTKLNLTDQKPLVHTIVQDAIENLRASLMFHHAFPDVMLAFSFSKESLITAAEKHKPGAAALHSRLLEDEDYLMKITQLVSSLVKEMTLLTLCGSHALGSHLCVLKLRSAATLLPWQQLWQSNRQIR